MYRKYFIIIFLCLFLGQSIYGIEEPNVSAEGVILIEAKTNTILYQKNAYQKFYPASITKLMTALIVEEELADGSIIKKSKDSSNKVPSDSSHIGLNVGQAYTKEEGLYGLLLGSDNFIAHDLAIATTGSIDSFAAKMNEKAKILGAKSTNFVNPHGYHNLKHYTTPYDMAQIARAAFANKVVTQIAGTPYHKFKIANTNQSIQIKNSSRLIRKDTPYYIKEVVATKTGYHSDAKQTIVAKGVYGDMELIAVVMKTNTPNQYKDVANLFEYGSQYFGVEKNAETYKLKNLTASKWAKSAVAGAEKIKGYVVPAKSYQKPIQVGELKQLVACMKGEAYGEAVEEIVKGYNLKDTSTLSRLTMAKIIVKLCNDKMLMYSVDESTLSIDDITLLQNKDEESIDYVVRRGLMGNKDLPFKPESLVTYEEAVCIMTRMM